MVCLSNLERNRKKSDMAMEADSLTVNKEVLEAKLSEVFYKSSVREIMKLVESVNLVKPEPRYKNVVQMTDEERAWFVSRNKHKWEINGRPSERRGGEARYYCSKCGKKIRSSFACLPTHGCEALGK